LYAFSGMLIGPNKEPIGAMYCYNTVNITYE